jgi:hypothetical protein
VQAFGICRVAAKQPAGGIVHESQQRAHRAAVLEPGVFRTVDLHQFAQTVAPLARLVRGGKAVPAVGYRPSAIVQPRRA